MGDDRSVPDRRTVLAGLAASALLGIPGCSPPGTRAAAERRFVEAVARRFGLGRDEGRAFDASWALYRRVVHLDGEPDGPRRLQALAAEARRQIRLGSDALAAAAMGSPTDQAGCARVERRPVGERLVVFSDHHLTFRGHRTNFFGASGNLELCAEALAAYHRSGFVLVENGDVEDLVLFDPALEVGEAEVRRDLDLDALRQRRLLTRPRQLERILADPGNAAYYDALVPFARDGRWVRLSGNHDHDLQRPELYALLAARVPGAPEPIDALVLERDGAAAWLVAHGHQLDTATNPWSAPRFGETISETLGVWFQGPDRTWRWVEDDLSGWVSGRAPFPGAITDGREAIGRVVRGDLRRWVRPFRPVDPRSEADALAEQYREVGDELFEALFQQDIAFEYFAHPDPVRAFALEVLTGDRWYKFRLLDERELLGWWADAFPDPARRPGLVLGHTHEARAGTAEGYANAGSVGRFENLLFGLEIVDGATTLVTWSRPAPRSGPPERRRWTLRDGGLWAGSPEPLPG